MPRVQETGPSPPPSPFLFPIKVNTMNRAKDGGRDSSQSREVEEVGGPGVERREYRVGVWRGTEQKSQCGSGREVRVEVMQWG